MYGDRNTHYWLHKLVLADASRITNVTHQYKEHFTNCDITILQDTSATWNLTTTSSSEEEGHHFIT